MITSADLLGRLSIKRKLILVNMATTLIALVVAGAIFGVYDYLTWQQALLAKLIAVSDIVGGNSAAAITFDDRRRPAANPRRLRAQDAIRGAAIYDAQFRVVASFDRSRRVVCAAPVAASAPPRCSRRAR